MRKLKILSVFTSILMAIVLLQGALVTNTGSGRGCGSTWPLCNGRLTPDWDIHSIIEYSHRTVSGLAGILVIIMSVWAWRALEKKREAGLLAFSAVFLIALQGGLGAAAVVWPQPKAVLALHFGFSLLSFASVVLLAILVFQKGRYASEPTPPSARFRNWTWGLFAYTYVVVYMGAYIRHTGASLACTGWPLCNGELIPELAGRVGAHFAHRVAAGLLVLLLGYYAVLARKERPDLSLAAVASFVLVLLQAVSGGLVVLSGLKLGPQSLHGGLMMLLFGALSYALWQVLPLRREVTVRQQAQG